MTFTKIKYDGSKVRLEYEIERPDGGESDEYSLLSGDKPAASFDLALQALVEDVVAICEFQKSDASTLAIRGVSLTHTDGILGACVTALKSLTTANSPLVINTPHLPESAYSGNTNDPNPLMPAGMAQRIAALMAEAEKYAAGARAQGDLFASDQQTTAA